MCAAVNWRLQAGKGRAPDSAILASGRRTYGDNQVTRGVRLHLTNLQAIDPRQLTGLQKPKQCAGPANDRSTTAGAALRCVWPCGRFWLQQALLPPCVCQAGLICPCDSVVRAVVLVKALQHTKGGQSGQDFECRILSLDLLMCVTLLSSSSAWTLPQLMSRRGAKRWLGQSNCR